MFYRVVRSYDYLACHPEPLASKLPFMFHILTSHEMFNYLITETEV